MARYNRVYAKFWRDGRDLGWNDQQRALGLYLLTCEHRTLEAFYRLPLGYVTADLGWTIPMVQRNLARLVADGFCAYDEQLEVAFVLKALSYQHPAGPKQLAGAVASLKELPASPLWIAFEEACDQWCKPLAEHVRNTFGTLLQGVWAEQSKQNGSDDPYLTRARRRISPSASLEDLGVVSL